MYNDDQYHNTVAYYNNNAHAWAKKKGPKAKVSFWMPELQAFQFMILT